MRRTMNRVRSTIRRRVAAVGIGAFVAAASLTPGVAARADTTTTVHGTVQSGSSRLAGVPVGFWSRTGTRIASTTTGSTGAFTLRVPSGTLGFAYAGTPPDSTKAIFDVAAGSYVRGVIGASQAGATSYRIYQGHASAAAANLAGGAALRFRLQRPGRITVAGGAYFQGSGDSEGVFQVLRLNGSFVSETAANPTTGTATSRPLVAGHYKVRYFPDPPYLRRTVSVTVVAGATTTLAPSFVKGATVSGVLSGPGGAPAAGVHVDALHGASAAGSDVTDANGRYSIPGLAAGDYRLRLGYNPQPDPEDLPEDPDSIQPATSNDYLAKTVPFSVDVNHHAVTKNAALARAGHVQGTITGATTSLRVLLETTTGRIVRTGGVTDGKYELGGLKPGTEYRLYAVTPSDGTEDGRYGKVDLTATSSTQTKDVAVTRRTLTLKGSVTRAPAVFVIVRSAGSVLPPLVGRFRSDSGSRSYTVRGLIPGRYTVTIDRLRDPLSSRPKPLTLTSSPTTVTRNYPAGPESGTYRVRFVSGKAPIRNVGITGVDRAGDVAFVQTEGRQGRATADTLYAGTYRYVASSFAHAGETENAPAVDGPWWFGAASHSFRITAGRTTNDGTIALHVHSHR